MVVHKADGSTQTATVTPPQATRAQSRSILLCLDETDKGVFQNTKAAKFFSLLRKGFNEQQLVLYNTFGKEKDKNQVLVIYQFLSDNYREGDRISILGQGRGAHIGGLLCRMIHNVGIVKPGDVNRELSENAYKLCFSGDVKDDARKTFKDLFSARSNIKVKFFGVWNTNPDTDYVPPTGSVDVFRHALALDERYPGPKRPAEWFPMQGKQIEGRKEKRNDRRSEQDRPKDVLEVWFPGVHDDLYGNPEESQLDVPSLSQLSLRWMVRQCLKADQHIQLIEENQSLLGIEVDQVAQELRPDQSELPLEIIVKVLNTIKLRNPALRGSRSTTSQDISTMLPTGSEDKRNQQNLETPAVTHSRDNSTAPSTQIHSPNSPSTSNVDQKKGIAISRRLSQKFPLQLGSKKSKPDIPLVNLEGSRNQPAIPKDPQNNRDFCDALCFPQNHLKPDKSWRSLWKSSNDVENIQDKQNEESSKGKTPEAVRQDNGSKMHVHQSVSWRWRAGRCLAQKSYDGTGEDIAALVQVLREYKPRIHSEEVMWVSP